MTTDLREYVYSAWQLVALRIAIRKSDKDGDDNDWFTCGNDDNLMMTTTMMPQYLLVMTNDIGIFRMQGCHVQ